VAGGIRSVLHRSFATGGHGEIHRKSGRTSQADQLRRGIQEISCRTWNRRMSFAWARQRKPRTSVLGHSQPSLAGLFLALISTQDWRPGLLSAVPSGLVPIRLESHLFSATTVQIKLIDLILKRQLLGIPRLSCLPDITICTPYFSSGTTVRMETGGVSRSTGKRNLSGERTIWRSR
jgi:hypothetical protein